MLPYCRLYLAKIKPGGAASIKAEGAGKASGGGTGIEHVLKQGDQLGDPVFDPRLLEQPLLHRPREFERMGRDVAEDAQREFGMQ